MSRFKLAAFIAVPLALIGAGITYAHQGGMHHGGQMGGPMMEMHLDHVQAMLGRIGASEDQKSQIDGILKGALGEMQSVHESHSAVHQQFHDLLLAPSVDRARIESLRAAQIKALDDASKRMVGAFEDAAEVLTPEQRAAFGREVSEHHGG